MRLPADGAIDNAVPSTDNLKNLRDVYTIYRKNFSDSVIMSRNADKQKQALMAAHKEIENQGLDKLIPSFPLNAGIS